MPKILAFGPLSTMLLGAVSFGGTEARSIALAAAILWAPTPIGIPSLITQGMGPLRSHTCAAGVTLKAWAVAGWLGALPYLAL